MLMSLFTSLNVKLVLEVTEQEVEKTYLFFEAKR